MPVSPEAVTTNVAFSPAQADASVGWAPIKITGAVTVKSSGVVAVFSETITVIGPVVAPAGTKTLISVSVLDCTTAPVPLKSTKLLDGVELKFVPAIVITVPTEPCFGAKSRIVGIGALVIL